MCGTRCSAVLAATLMAAASGCNLQDTREPPISAGVPDREADEEQTTQAASTAEKPTMPATRVLAASGVLKAADGHEVGRVALRQQGSKATVTVKVRGLPPGAHGLHFHEKGECTGPDFRSAGGHFNPMGTSHGGPGDRARHAGDFGNLTVGKDRRGSLTITSDQITLGAGKRSVIGRSVVIHEAADDLRTQPTGNSGSRIACAVITAATR